MKQSSGIPAMLVFALLAAVCIGGATTAAAARPTTSHAHTGADAAAIRLPSSSSGVGRPWECCDMVIKDPSFRPGRWRCDDVVAECSADCRECEAAGDGDGDGFVCRDWVISLFEPPVCTPRPWDCCDVAFCTRGYIPYCQCADAVESCPSNCKECEQVASDDDAPLYRCRDVFHGYPGPKCSPWIKHSN